MCSKFAVSWLLERSPAGAATGACPSDEMFLAVNAGEPFTEPQMMAQGLVFLVAGALLAQCCDITLGKSVFSGFWAIGFAFACITSTTTEGVCAWILGSCSISPEVVSFRVCRLDWHAWTRSDCMLQGMRRPAQRCCSRCCASLRTLRSSPSCWQRWTPSPGRTARVRQPAISLRTHLRERKTEQVSADTVSAYTMTNRHRNEAARTLSAPTLPSMAFRDVTQFEKYWMFSIQRDAGWNSRKTTQVGHTNVIPSSGTSTLEMTQPPRRLLPDHQRLFHSFCCRH